MAESTFTRRLLEDTDLYYWSLSKRLIRGQPFTIIPPLKALYRDPQQEVYIEKAAQVFISEYLINLTLFAADTGWGSRGNVLYIFPATPQISDFSMARIEPVILESKYLLQRRNYVKEVLGGVTVKNVQLKRIGNGNIYLRGSNKRTQLVTVDADVVIFDEVDEMAEGTISAGQARTGSSLSPFYRGASTPKYPRLGIDALLEQSDDKKWLVHCTRCNHDHDLAKMQDFLIPITEKTKLENLRVDAGDEETGTLAHLGNNYYIGCPQCGHIINCWNGRWVASRTEGVNFGGYHIPKLISNRIDFDLLAKRAEDSREGRLSEVKEQEFHNSDLGLPRAPKGAQISIVDFLNCAQDTPDWYNFNLEAMETYYPLKEPPYASYMGVDVAPGRLHIFIMGFAANVPELAPVVNDNPERPIPLYAGSIHVDSSKLGFPELDVLMARYHVMRCCIDVRPEQMNSREFTRRNGGRAYVVEYIAWKNKPANAIWLMKPDDRKFQAGRTETLDVVFSYIQTNSIPMPNNVKVIGGNVNIHGNGEFVQHFLNLTKVTDMEKQEANYIDGGNPDHLAHAMNYAFIAAQISNLANGESRSAILTDLTKAASSAPKGVYDERIFSSLIGGVRTKSSGGRRNAASSYNRRGTLTPQSTHGY